MRCSTTRLLAQTARVDSSNRLLAQGMSPTQLIVLPQISALPIMHQPDTASFQASPPSTLSEAEVFSGRLSSALMWQEVLQRSPRLASRPSQDTSTGRPVPSTTFPSRACLVKPILGRALSEWWNVAVTKQDFCRALDDVREAADEYFWSRSSRSSRLRDTFRTLRDHTEGHERNGDLLGYVDAIEYSLTASAETLNER